MDKTTKYNNGEKYILVAVDLLSRFSRVEPMKTKTATDTTRVLTTKIFPEKVWSGKGTEFKGEFKQFYDSQKSGAIQYNQWNEVCFCRAKYPITETYKL